MRHLVVFWALLCHIRYAAVQAQTAIWKFPTQGEDIQANAIDTVLLDWTSTLPSTILRMWCVNGTDGVTQDLASSFVVNSTGPFPYILETYDPNETSFPLLCHAELASSPLGSGVDSPAGITWHSDPAEAAKTISQTRTASSVTVTTSSSSSSTTRSTTTNSLPQSTTPTPTGSGSPSSPTTAPQPSTPASPNNTGPIVGGVIGGIALISFIILALLFLRKYRRDHTSSSLSATEPSKQGFHLSSFYKKGGPKAGTTGIFEKEGDHGAYEKDATGLSEGTKVPELQGSVAWKKPPSRGDDAIHYHPVELPDHSSFS
ncbi:hypothetical protein N431DRAFT_555177 [Stipitochalara longipes BDJ]|nr:hypothetical protein N431DRAFT_555177 [Stipitochalara longipes BDJ]